MHVSGTKNAMYPGFHALQESLHNQPEARLDEARLEPFVQNTSHKKYLENETYHRYLKMHKVAVNSSGARELYMIGEELSGEYMPQYKDAAAWAYAESGLLDTSASTVERIRRVSLAEQQWSEALDTESQLQSTEYSALFTEPDTQYRLAIALAYAPLIKSVIVGNVTPGVRRQVLADTTLFSAEISEQISRYGSVGDREMVNGFIGLAHELNALMALLYLDDPRYVPFPSTARADSGYYHPQQTHDIMVINQHWGTIKKVIPMEIKARPSRRDRMRYKALLVRGKMHLTAEGVDPRMTSQSFHRYQQGEATLQDTIDIEKISTDLREMLRLYQKGVTPESLAVNSITRFYNSKELDQRYPEIAV